MSTVISPPPAQVVPGPTGPAGQRLPQVNLLPEAFAQQARTRRTWQWFLVAGAVLVALVAGGWLVQRARLGSARDDLAAQTRAETRARATLTPLLAYQTFAEQVNAQRTEISTTMSRQVSMAGALGAVAAAEPAGGTVTALVVDTAKSCPGPDPFAVPTSVGCATLTSLVPGQPAAETLGRQLETTAGLTASTITSMQVSQQGVSTSATANLTRDLLTHRYDALAKETTP